MSLEGARLRVIDLETTGLDPEVDGIVELASVDYVIRDGSLEVSQTFEQLVNPGMPIPPEASAIHHLTDKDVADAATQDEVLEAFRRQPSAIRVAHNAAFDARFLGDDPHDYLCTLVASQHLLSDYPKHGNQYLRYALDLAVGEAQGRLPHRALADCYVTGALLEYLINDEAAVERAQSMIARLDQTNLNEVELSPEAWIDISNQPVVDQICHFGKHRGERWSEVPEDYIDWMKSLGASAWEDRIVNAIRVELTRRRIAAGIKPEGTVPKLKGDDVPARRHGAGQPWS